METLSYVSYLLLTCIFITVTHFLLPIKLKPSSKNLPPGPKPFPIIGNLFHLDEKPHKSLAKLAETYGPIMSLKLGQVTTIVISSSTMAKEILQNHDVSFSDRTIPDAVRAHQHHEKAMPWLPVSHAWKNLRKICNSQLFTMSKLNANQHLRHQKIEQLIHHVRDSCREGKSVDIGQAAFETSLNLLSNTIFSIDLSDPKSNIGREYKAVVCGIFEDIGKPNLADYFPMLREFDIQGIRRRMTIYFRRLYELFDCLIDQRLKLREVERSIAAKDMLDILLNISEDNKEIDRNSIKILFLDLFSAGTDTTSSTLEWAMTELLCNINVLSKAQLELKQTIGKGNLVEEVDISRLPYLRAIVKETLRLHPPAPLLLPRKAKEEVEINGFTVPKGAQIFVNVWTIGRDENKWENSNAFVPERHLGSDSSEIGVNGRNFELIPFGAGRRICPGLPLAMRMLHLMLGSLINSFDWKLEDGITPKNINMDDKFGLTLQKAQPLCAIPIPIK